MKIQGGDALLARQKNRKPGVWIAVIAAHHGHNLLLREQIPPGIPNGESVAKMVWKLLQQTCAEQKIHLRHKCKAFFQVLPLVEDRQIFPLRLSPARLGSQIRTDPLGKGSEVGTPTTGSDSHKT